MAPEDLGARTEEDPRPEPDDSARVWNERAEASFKAGRWEDAVTNYCMAIERDPSVAAYWYGRGMAFRELRYDAMMRADLAQAAALGHPLARVRPSF
jgi:tetratricopeptide (TPR) repeat protein